MDPFIFTVSAVFVVKNTDKVDPWKSNFSEVKIHTGSILFAFFTRKNDWVHQKPGEILNKIDASKISVHNFFSASENV